jgi:hypothetical protein
MSIWASTISVGYDDNPDDDHVEPGVPRWASTPAADAVRDALHGQPDQVVAGVCAAVEGDMFATTPALHIEDKSGWPRCSAGELTGITDPVALGLLGDVPARERA